MRFTLFVHVFSFGVNGVQLMSIRIKNIFQASHKNHALFFAAKYCGEWRSIQFTIDNDEFLVKTWPHSGWHSSMFIKIETKFIWCWNAFHIFVQRKKTRRKINELVERLNTHILLMFDLFSLVSICNFMSLLLVLMVFEDLKKKIQITR